jgi:hypothetical protein
MHLDKKSANSLLASFTMEEEMRRRIKGDVVSKHFYHDYHGSYSVRKPFKFCYVYKK